MRINKYVAAASALSRRAADAAIADGRVMVNGRIAEQGMEVGETDVVALDGHILKPVVSTTTIILNKPTGYVCSRNGQGSRTIYDLLPPEYQQLNPVGRLDKDSSGLLLLTNNGQLAQELSHPKYQKTKVYEVVLNHPLLPLSRQIISDHGVMLEDGRSQFELERLREGDDTAWRITMHEGRNRQIRRTFAALGFTVVSLHRTHFGSYSLGPVKSGDTQSITS